MITVLTPTYNRGNDLKRLYDSLCKQTQKEFEWLIVDDGSQDNTQEIVNDFRKDCQFEIKYIKKENGGKHTALNVGINIINTSMTFIVDSDDFLTFNAVETINLYYEKYKNRKDICGFSFLRQFDNGQINGSKFDQDEVIGTLIDIRINSGDASSDKAEVYFTECLKNFPFPEFEGEKFLGEDLVWMRMARKYKMVFINRVIYIGTYLEGGLTKNRRVHNIKSPNGCVLRAQEFMKPDINIKIREKSTLQYLIYGWFAKRATKDLIVATDYKVITLVNILPAMIIYKKWKKKFEESK